VLSLELWSSFVVVPANYHCYIVSACTWQLAVSHSSILAHQRKSLLYVCASRGDSCVVCCCCCYYYIVVVTDIRLSLRTWLCRTVSWLIRERLFCTFVRAMVTSATTSVCLKSTCWSTSRSVVVVVVVVVAAAIVIVVIFVIIVVVLLY